MKKMSAFILTGMLVLSTISPASAAPTEDELAVWVKDAVMAVMAFNSEDYDQKKSENEKYFTPDGYTLFYAEMDSAGMPEFIVKMKGTSKPLIVCKPEVSKDEKNPEKWIATFPMNIEYSTPEKTKTRFLDVTIRIGQKSAGAGVWNHTLGFTQPGRKQTGSLQPG